MYCYAVNSMVVTGKKSRKSLYGQGFSRGGGGGLGFFQIPHWSGHPPLSTPVDQLMIVDDECMTESS